MNDIGVLHLTGKKGTFAIVDAELLPSLSRRTWFQSSHGYIKTPTYDPKTQKSGAMYLHRVVNQTPEGLDTDHINGFKIDNTRRNLRTATTTQNCQNQRHQTRQMSSRFKGVCWTAICSKHWQAYITVNRKRIHLGRFYTEKEAAEAYNAASKQHFGEFAHLNAI